ncbi:MAG: hypothetical protein ACPF8V_06800 [Luteibaculum sp.]
MKYLRLLFLLLALSFYACEEEIDVFGPYQEVPVVFGLINTDDTTHYVRITRTYVGEGNNLDAAKIADSSFAEVEAVQVILNEGLASEKIHNLDLRQLAPKQNGEFFTEPNLAYAFEEPSIGQYSTAKLSFLFNGVTYSAEMNIVGRGTLVLPFTGADITIVRNNTASGQEPDYRNIRTELSSGRNARSYSVNVKFYYTEVKTDGSREQKFFEEKVSDRVLQNTDGGQSVENEFSGSSFIERLAIRAVDNSNVARRILGRVEVSFTGIDEELYIYRQSTSASVGVGQEIVNYTNIKGENGEQALGIFGAAGTARAFYDLNNTTQIAFLALPALQKFLFCSEDQEVINAYPQGACE